MTRVSTARLLAIGGELREGERELVRIVDKLRLASHVQLAALLAGNPRAVREPSAARTARRVLARLTAAGVLRRLERRIGGVRAGSAGYVYYLGPVGQRLVAYWNGQGLVRGRPRPEPGGRYVRHRLAVSQLYVDAMLAHRAGDLDLLAGDVEPDCWRRYLDGLGGTTLLKPDAYIRVGLGAYEDRYFVEVDLGSESRSVIARKLRAYWDYFNSGQEQAQHGVFPRVLLLTVTEARRAALVDVCRRLPADAWSLFAVSTLDQALAIVTGGAVSGDDEQRALGGLS